MPDRPGGPVDGAALVPLSIAEHLENLRTEGRRLGEAAATAGFAAPVPGCPGWTVAELVGHVGDVHRWATTIVRERRQERVHRDVSAPAHHRLLDWYAQGHEGLLQALADATPEAVFWSWAPAPSPLAFWARRQAHETAIHRLDAEQAGGTAAPFATPQAADGIDEWLTIASQRIRSTSGSGGTLHLVAVDGPWRWAATLGAGGIAVLDQAAVDGVAAVAHCTVRGRASDLFALAMNRRDAEGLTVEGDSQVLRAWRESVRF